jgi:hypothetical protein
VSWSDDGGAEPSEADDAEDESDSVVVRPISSAARVGTLRRRIIRAFDLERFDIDVVICKAGDSDRRQLKSSAPLKTYKKEET